MNGFLDDESEALALVIPPWSAELKSFDESDVSEPPILPIGFLMERLLSPPISRFKSSTADSGSMPKNRA